MIRIAARSSSSGPASSTNCQTTGTEHKVSSRENNFDRIVACFEVGNWGVYHCEPTDEIEARFPNSTIED